MDQNNFIYQITKHIENFSSALAKFHFNKPQRVVKPFPSFIHIIPSFWLKHDDVTVTLFLIVLS